MHDEVVLLALETARPRTSNMLESGETRPL